MKPVRRLPERRKANDRACGPRVLQSYGRLVAYLSVHTHDVASAEDALSDALVAALDHWPQDGVPQNPEAWLMTAARRSIIDVIRHNQVVLAKEPVLMLIHEDSTEAVMATQF